MKKFTALLFILLLLLPGVFALAQEDVVLSRLEEFATALPEQGYGIISASDLSVMLIEQDVVLLDVREPGEYSAGHLEESFSVPIRELGQNLALLPDLDANIVVVCKGGARAMLAATTLRLLGYEDVKVLAGGYDAWVGDDLPTTTEPYTIDAGTAPEIDEVLFSAVDTYLSTLPEGFSLVSAQNLNVEMVENPPILIDVRGDAEWANGYIEGAQHIWINEFFFRQDEWPADKDANIVVYCASSYRGAIAAVMMELMGYTNVRNLNGGLNAWAASQLPVAGAPEAAAESEAFELDTYLAEYVAALPNTFNALRPTDLAAELESSDNLLVVDVRTPDEYAEGFIEGAINIPLNELTQHLDLLPDLDANIVVVCGTGHRSAIAMTALNLLGYTNARSMMSGMGPWTSAGLPTVQTTPTHTGGDLPQFDPILFDEVDSFITSIPQGYYTVRAADLGAELIDNPPLVIDVRTDSEWDSGHIEDALHISLRDFMSSRAEWPEDLTTPIVVYDNPIHRSSMALTLMRLLGYENVRALGGGVTAWTNAGLPLVSE
jgi:rhodanese-related sulfurtransferase